MNKTFNIFLTALVFIITNSCVDEQADTPLTGNLESTAEMLFYFESTGDYANSSEAPALINADDVYANLGNFLIVDIRSTDDFRAGHIDGSLNIIPDSLYDFFETANVDQYKKIIIVSRNGQSAAYFTCLLRLAGHNNVFTMNFGLASWNSVFADDWLNAIGVDRNLESYINDPRPKNNYTDLPKIIFDNSNATIEQRVMGRIKKIMSEGFKEGINFEREISSSPEEYLVCYGTSKLYYSPRTGPLPLLGHNSAAVLYFSYPTYELRSTQYLQTLPTDRKILIYDETGQLSAGITAYLRVFGYDASTLLFGGNQLVYPRLIGYPETLEFAFDESNIKEYPYITE